MDKYKDLLVEAWSWDNECLMLIKAIKKSKDEAEKKEYLDNMEFILKRQTQAYKKLMVAEHDASFEPLMDIYEEE